MERLNVIMIQPFKILIDIYQKDKDSVFIMPEQDVSFEALFFGDGSETVSS